MGVDRVIELVGGSPERWEKAVEEALKKTKEKYPNIKGIDVIGFKAVVKDGQIVEYRANVKIACLL